MIPRPIWQAPYERGLAHLRAGAMDEALKAFDEAHTLSPHMDTLPFRSRRAVLDALRVVVEAVYDSEGRPDELLPEPNEVSDGRLFTILSRLPHSHRAAILSTHTGGEMSASQAQIVEQADSHLAMLITRRNLIDYLPHEVLTIIGRLAVEDAGSSDVAFTLAAVSHRWRTVFLAHSRMWGLVRLDGKTQAQAIVKAEACLARGPIRHLVVDYGPLVDKTELLAALKGRLPGARSVGLLSPKSSLLDAVNLVDGSSELETLRLLVQDDLRLADLQLPGQVRQHIRLPVRRLEICRRDLFVVLISFPIVCISRLLIIFPELEDIVIDHPSICLLRLASNDTSTLTVPTLRRLTLSRRNVRRHTYRTTTVVLPRLESLDLSDSPTESYLPYLFPPSLPPNTQHLTHLLLHRSDIDEAALIGHLPHLVALTHLDVRSWTRPPFVNLFHALTHPAKDETRPRLCPALVRLEVRAKSSADNINLRSEAVVLVESRSGEGVGELRVHGWRRHAQWAWAVPS